MSEMNATTHEQADKQARLTALFNRLLPLVDNVADKLRFAVLLGAAMVLWVFVWLHWLQGYSLAIALTVAGIALLPILLLAYFWWSLEELKDLPNIAARMLADAKNSAQSTVQQLQAGRSPKLGFIGSAKGLWSIGSLVLEARELLGSYLSIGALLNPLMLVLAVLSLLFVLLLTVVGAILALVAVL